MTQISHQTLLYDDVEIVCTRSVDDKYSTFEFLAKYNNSSFQHTYRANFELVLEMNKTKEQKSQRKAETDVAHVTGDVESQTHACKRMHQGRHVLWASPLF